MKLKSSMDEEVAQILKIWKCFRNHFSQFRTVACRSLLVENYPKH